MTGNYPLDTMFGRGSQLVDASFKTLRYLANQYDIAYDADWHKPGNTPVQEAFLLCRYGVDLLVKFCEPDQFPSFDRTSRRVGAKLMKRNVLFSGPAHAPFFAQTIAELLARTEGRLFFDDPIPEGAPGTSAPYRRQRSTLQDFYPSVSEALELLDNEAPAEFEVLEKGEPRAAVRAGEEAASAYSAALLRGENPNDNPALVKEQWEYARDYFIWRCEKAAMRSAMDRPTRARFRFEEVVTDLIDFTTPESGGPQEDPKRLAYRAEALKRWEEPVRACLSYAVIAASARENHESPTTM